MNGVKVGETFIAKATGNAELRLSGNFKSQICNLRFAIAAWQSVEARRLPPKQPLLHGEGIVQTTNGWQTKSQAVAKAIVVRKSSGPKGRAGSSPALGINKKAGVECNNFAPAFLFIWAPAYVQAAPAALPNVRGVELWL